MDFFARFDSRHWAARGLASVVVGIAILASNDAAPANKYPQQDLPGIISSREDHGLVPLKSVDVDFYMKVMRAAFDRCQHPTAQDLSDLAENQKLLHLQALGTAKMTEDLKAGDTQKAIKEVFNPTPDQKAIMDRSDDLRSVPEMLARQAAMPRQQWSDLATAVESAAGLNGEYSPPGWGNGDDVNWTAEKKASLQNVLAERKRVFEANQHLVAPNAAEIKTMRDFVYAVGVKRGEAVQAAMVP
jgi:hypothetical protein